MEPPYDADDICSAYETGAMENFKPSWSEEDELMRQTAIEACKTVAEDYENSNARFYKCKDWLEYMLKSLRPSWKPSEEQMEALRLSFEDAFDDAGDCYRYRELKSIYEQLKKLM